MTSHRRIYGFLAGLVLITSVLWLESFDRYLNSRYHVELSSMVPEMLFQPSRLVAQQLTASEDGVSAEKSTALANQAETRLATPCESKGRLKSTACKDAPTARSTEIPKFVTHGTPPRILFAGDSMMQGVAPLVISDLRKAYPEGFFSDQSKQSTGLTVKRYFDWPTKIKEEVEKNRFDTVVIFLGPNDPWDIYEGSKRFVFPSEQWVEKYRSRVEEVMSFARERRVNIVWLGLPNMRDERLRKGAELGNLVFREEASRFGFRYLATEDLIGRLDSPFNRYIQDPEKGPVAVRAEDGIHFTQRGLRLIAKRVIDSLTAQRLS